MKRVYKEGDIQSRRIEIPHLNFEVRILSQGQCVVIVTLSLI